MRPKPPNVAEQNDKTREEISPLTAAFHDRTAGYPDAIYAFLAEKGVDVSPSVLVSVSRAEQGIDPVCGLLLTQDEHFMGFDLDFSTDGSEVLEVHAWIDETAAQNLNAHNPGTGKGLGCIALEILRQT